MGSTQIGVARLKSLCEAARMTTAHNDSLEARAKAYAAMAEAYAADPAYVLYLDQVRRDADVAHRWLANEAKDKST